MSANALRLGLAATAFAGVICLLLATFSTIIEIRVGTTTKVPGHDTHLSGWDRHGPALVLIAVIGDVPDLNETGFIGEVYEDAAAGPKLGFYLETLGAVLLLAAGGLMLAAERPARERSATAA